MAGNSAEPGRSVTSKIVAILLAFHDGDEHSLTDIARARLPVSTAHRLLAELTTWGVLERTDGSRFRIGLLIKTLGRLRFPTSILESARRVLEDLVTATRTGARLRILTGTDVAYIEKRCDYRPVTIFTQTPRLPAHATALGKVLLSFAAPEIIDRVLANGLERYTPDTVTDAQRLRQSLASIRLTQVAVSRSELEPGLSGVGVAGVRMGPRCRRGPRAHRCRYSRRSAHGTFRADVGRSRTLERTHRDSRLRRVPTDQRAAPATHGRTGPATFPVADAIAIAATRPGHVDHASRRTRPGRTKGGHLRRRIHIRQPRQLPAELPKELKRGASAACGGPWRRCEENSRARATSSSRTPPAPRRSLDKQESAAGREYTAGLFRAASQRLGISKSVRSTESAPRIGSGSVLLSRSTAVPMPE